MVDVRVAINDGRLDDAAERISGWTLRYAYNRDLPMTERLDMLGEYNALGLALVSYFEHPAALEHARFEELLDGPLRSVARESRTIVPGAQNGYFGSVYVALKNQSALGREKYALPALP